MKLILTILLFFALFSVSAQKPQFTWGNTINRDPRQLSNMKVVGIDDDGFFATYESDRQITLEHFNNDNVRLWTTALLPKSPEGKPAKFHSIQMIKGVLYMVSSGVKDNKTEVYAQEILPNGNYSNTVVTLARGKFGKQIHIATAQDEAALIVVLSGDNQQEITSALLTDQLKPRWSRTLTSGGDMQEVLVHSDGSTYLLTKALAASPSTSSFYLYRLEAKSGKYEEIILGDKDFRPYKAKLVATPHKETVVAGYTIPSSYVASQNPEPVGTFYYRFNGQKLNKPIVNYTPFKAEFIQSYKRLKPDNDNSQRLRNLHLDRAVPVGDGGVILIGEENYRNSPTGFALQHNNDIVITRLRKDGSQAYINSANKLQTTTENDLRLHSYFATTIGDTLKIIFQHFEYSSETDAPGASSNSARKTPVLINLLPDGTKQIFSLEDSASGQQTEFHLCPTATFQASDREFIVLGLGKGYYRYGRMSFN